MKNFRNIIKGFTLAEATVCFILIGVVLVTTLGSIRRKTDYTKLYYQAFNILYQAAKSMDSESVYCPSDCNNNCAENEICYRSKCWRGDNHQYCPKQEREGYPNTTATLNIGREFPGILFPDVGNPGNMNFALSGSGEDDFFCEKLTEKINLAPGIKCKSFISVANDAAIGKNSAKGGVNFFDAFPASKYDKANNKYLPIDDNNGKNDTNITPSFIASNGQRFYISKVVTANLNGSGIDAKFVQNTRESYRMVVVDLNGKSLPNSQFKTGEQDPDLVLFAITSAGDVIPLGLPEFSRSYINAYITYPDGKKSAPMSLWNAKKYAFGMDTKDITAGVPLFGRLISMYDPMSQSSKFYHIASKCKGTSCSSKTMDDKDLYADDLLVNLVLQFMYKGKGLDKTSGEITKQWHEEFDSTPAQDNPTDIEIRRGCNVIKQSRTDDPENNTNPVCGIDFEH